MATVVSMDSDYPMIQTEYSTYITSFIKAGLFAKAEVQISGMKDFSKDLEDGAHNFIEDVMLYNSDFITWEAPLRENYFQKTSLTSRLKMDRLRSQRIFGIVFPASGEKGYDASKTKEIIGRIFAGKEIRGDVLANLENAITTHISGVTGENRLILEVRANYVAATDVPSSEYNELAYCQVLTGDLMEKLRVDAYSEYSLKKISGAIKKTGFRAEAEAGVDIKAGPAGLKTTIKIGIEKTLHDGNFEVEFITGDEPRVSPTFITNIIKE
jgi:hypothetical protein